MAIAYFIVAFVVGYLIGDVVRQFWKYRGLKRALKDTFPEVDHGGKWD